MNSAKNESIPSANKSPEQYIKSVPNKTSIYLNPTSPDEIEKIINSLKFKKSSGVDGINAIILKGIKYEICEPISTLINMSLEKGIFPACMKTAKVVPIYKSKQKDQFTNYRPISLLPTISKNLEKIMHKRIYGFIEKKILYNSQYGFRPNHCTINALTEFTSEVLNSTENKLTSIAVYLDLSKAFDTLDHNILLRKLHHYGIRGIALDWFRSYLTDRNMYVDYKGITSKVHNINYGVPQGSVLGPLLDKDKDKNIYSIHSIVIT